MTTMKSAALFAGLAAALIPSSMQPARVRNRPAGLMRYRAIDRVERTKQRDQQAKLDRRRQRQMFDDQMWQRQRAKWG